MLAAWMCLAGAIASSLIGVEVVCSPVGGLGDEKENKGEEGGGEDGDEVEGPLPAQSSCYLANNDRREECATK